MGSLTDFKSTSNEFLLVECNGCRDDDEDDEEDVGRDNQAVVNDDEDRLPSAQTEKVAKKSQPFEQSPNDAITKDYPIERRKETIDASIKETKQFLQDPKELSQRPQQFLQDNKHFMQAPKEFLQDSQTYLQEKPTKDVTDFAKDFNASSPNELYQFGQTQSVKLPQDSTPFRPPPPTPQTSNHNQLFQLQAAHLLRYLQQMPQSTMPIFSPQHQQDKQLKSSTKDNREAGAEEELAAKAIMAVHPQSLTPLTLPDRTEVDGRKNGNCRRWFCATIATFKWTLMTDTLIFLAVVAVCGVVELGLIDAPLAGYRCKDPNLSHPYQGDTVTVPILMAVTIIVPGIVLFGIEYIVNGRSNARSSIGWYRKSIVGSLLSLLLVEVAKLLIREHRPHFLQTCRPDVEEQCVVGTYVDNYVCTGTHVYGRHVVIDSSRSFPSGHSALSWFIGIYLTAFIHYRYAKDRGGLMVKPLLMVLCLIWSICCSLSRLTDRRHHWQDVAVGTLIGIAVGVYYVVAVADRFRTKPEKVVVIKKDTPSAYESGDKQTVLEEMV